MMLALSLAVMASTAAAAGACKKAGPAPAQADRDPAGPAAAAAADPSAAPSGGGAAAPAADPQPPAPAPAAKDPPTVNQPPPTVPSPPAQDTARYVAWMAQRGKPVKDTPREATELRLGDWGFFDHGAGPGQFLDRAALDKSGHAILPQEQADWHALLTAPGIDAAGALRRVAWLFSAGQAPVGPRQPKVTPPTLAAQPDGSIKLQGWLVFPPNTAAPMRITITATPAGAKLVNEAAKNL